MDARAALAKARIGEDALVERHVGLHPFDDQLIERDAHAGDRGFPIGAMGDELADQRIVVRRDPVAIVEM